MSNDLLIDSSVSCSPQEENRNPKTGLFWAQCGITSGLRREKKQQRLQATNIINQKRTKIYEAVNYI